MCVYVYVCICMCEVCVGVVCTIISGCDRCALRVRRRSMYDRFARTRSMHYGVIGVPYVCVGVVCMIGFV